MRDRIVAKARSWIGVRWRHQGRTRHGVDCVGLIYVVGAALNLVSYDFRGYGRDTSILDIDPHLRAAGMIEHEDTSTAMPGDVILIRDRIMPVHMAILTGGSRAVQASAAHRMVVEDTYRGARNIMAVYSYPGVPDG